MKKIQKNQLALLGGLFMAGLLSAYAPAGSSPEARTAGSALTGRAAGLTGRAAGLADSLDAQTGLVLAPGWQVVKNNCVRCHSPKLITAKRATREGWEGTIRWMQQTQGLGNLGSDEKPILDYLAKHYAPTQEGRRPALKNIDWYKLNP
ncbi:MAG: hypothetical protein ACO1NZ_07570 [Adhaeribacter sp.]